MSNYVLLPPRALHIALAHCFVASKPGRDKERLEILNRIYSRMKIAEQFKCRAEMLNCRKAQRGITLAEIGGTK